MLGSVGFVGYAMCGTASAVAPTVSWHDSFVVRGWDGCASTGATTAC
jgi:hypothetical protein